MKARRMRRPLMLLIAAPSGAGKTTVCQQLQAATSGLARVVTCTTRPARAGERNGVDYHFLAPDEFARRVAAGEFLEHATVYGHQYGTLRREVLDRLEQGSDVLLNVDVQGAATIRLAAAADAQLGEALVTIFLTPARLEELERRLRLRAQDDEAVIQRRLAAARQEVACWDRFDYLVLSTTKTEDIRRVKVIYEAEQMRRTRAMSPQLDD